MFHRIDKMTVEGPTFLNVTFKDGVFCRYDIAPLMERYGGIFSPLKNAILFSQAKVAAGGYGVVWNADIDLCAEDIYDFATAQRGAGGGRARREEGRGKR